MAAMIFKVPPHWGQCSMPETGRYYPSGPNLDYGGP